MSYNINCNLQCPSQSYYHMFELPIYDKFWTYDRILNCLTTGLHLQHGGSRGWGEADGYHQHDHQHGEDVPLYWTVKKTKEENLIFCWFFE